MNPADEEAAKIEPPERQLSGAAASPDDKLDEQLRVSAEDLLRPSHQPKAGEDLHELRFPCLHNIGETDTIILGPDCIEPMPHIARSTNE
jgi:hypothetical protein